MSRSSAERRRNNRVRVLEALRRDGDASRADLARALGLSKVTLSAIASEILEQGWVVEREGEAGSIGRRPTLLRLAPALGVVGTVDIHAESLAVRINDLRGAVLAEQTRATAHDAESLCKGVFDALTAACAACKREPETLLAVGLAVPAAVDTAGQLHTIGQPACLAEIDWRAEFAQRWPRIGVSLVNNNNAATLAEHLEGAAIDWSNFAFVGIGQSGLGCGLVLGDRLYRGSHHGAGEIGALMLGDDGIVLDRLADSPRTDDFYRRLAQLISLMVHLLDMDGIVLHAADHDHATWVRELPKALARHSSREVVLRAAALGERAPMIGAARLATDAAWRMLEKRMRTRH
ncbi:ROK family transcriptional regulator [Salinisphaera sp. SPP-AMP-43]|uniref:ROK family transcriptional regulator n=1 Tax=Salinisphaera sp. SPP-AMP-43 TaxID=3121288 RepID=UPI003C6DD7DF